MTLSFDADFPDASLVVIGLSVTNEHSVPIFIEINLPEGLRLQYIQEITRVHKKLPYKAGSFMYNILAPCLAGSCLQLHT
jgi:hypothetical protein